VNYLIVKKDTKILSNRRNNLAKKGEIKIPYHELIRETRV